MIQFRTIAILLFYIVITACCPTTSICPLSSPEKAIYDKQLEGSWIFVSKEGDVDGYLHVGKIEKNLTKAIAIEIKSSGELEHVILNMFPTKIGQDSYLNIKAEELFQEISSHDNGYIFAKYELSGNKKLAVYCMDDEPIAKAIQSGKLKGKITYENLIASEEGIGDSQKKFQKKIKCMQITDSSENILRFIQNSDPHELFPKKHFELIKQKNKQNR